MKNIFFLTLLGILMLSCKTSSVTSTKLDRKSQVGIKGNWIISSVSYPGSQYIKVNSFQLADSKCFEGSTWRFISNNNKGNMALTKFDCPIFSSPITWYVNEKGEFILKILDAGEKAKKVRDGYVLQLANQNDYSFQLIDRLMIGGQLTDVVYQFQKAD